jgi:hypothetical protein
MTTTLNATTSNGLVVTPDNSGNIVLQYNGVAAPAFSVYKSSTQALTSGTYTKVTWSTAVFDTNSNFSIANSRFTPTVAGYYQFSYTVNLNGNVAPNSAFTGLYKNGSQFYNFPQVVATTVYAVAGSGLIYLNGSTDYIEVYVQTSASSCSIYGDATNTWFNGILVRGA